jgi:hypothetical protein
LKSKTKFLVYALVTYIIAAVNYHMTETIKSLFNMKQMIKNDLKGNFYKFNGNFVKTFWFFCLVLYFLKFKRLCEK